MRLDIIVVNCFVFHRMLSVTLGLRRCKHACLFSQTVHSLVDDDDVIRERSEAHSSQSDPSIVFRLQHLTHVYNKVSIHRYATLLTITCVVLVLTSISNLLNAFYCFMLLYLVLACTGRTRVVWGRRC